MLIGRQLKQQQSRMAQTGVGLIEVLVALILLSITVLGYGTLQLHAMNAAQTANQRLQAISLAQDLAERIRVNRQGLVGYQGIANGEQPHCVGTERGGFCQPLQMAAHDLAEVSEKAKAVAMRLAVLPCQNSLQKRLCIYVAWGQTTATDGETHQDCTQGARYVMHSRCIVMETYAYAT